MKRFRLSTLMLLVIIVALSTAWIVEHRKMRRYEVVYLREQQKEIQAAKQAAEMEPYFRAIIESFAARQTQEPARGVKAGKTSVTTDAVN